MLRNYSCHHSLSLFWLTKILGNWSPVTSPQKFPGCFQETEYSESELRTVAPQSCIGVFSKQQGNVLPKKQGFYWQEQAPTHLLASLVYYCITFICVNMNILSSVGSEYSRYVCIYLLILLWNNLDLDIIICDKRNSMSVIQSRGGKLYSYILRGCRSMSITIT